MVSFAYPVDPHPIERGFSSTHPGIDFSVPVGTPVHAPANGNVVFVGMAGDCGNMLTISHAEGYTTKYCHLSKFSVIQGQAVALGTTVALSGGQPGSPGAGNATGPHLHFEVVNPSGASVDPTPFLTGGSVTGTSNASAKASDGGPSTLDAIVTFFHALVDPQTWVRVGEIVAALILGYFAYIIIQKDLSFVDLKGML